MRVRQFFIACIILMSFTVHLVSQTGHPEPRTLEPGTKAPDFSLPGTDGKTYSFSDFGTAQALVVVFSCNHCPTAQAYEDRIISISKDYKSRGAEVIMISSNSVEALTLRNADRGQVDLTILCFYRKHPG